MQRLQPEIKKLQERYKDDRQRMQQETMRLYKEHKVNPLGSCLPLLLQIPFFIALFYLLRGDEFKMDIQGAESFLFIPDLGAPATGAVLVVLVVLYVATQLGASLVSLATADKMQRRIFLALPFVFVFFILSFPTGLIVYWITTNVWTVGQQLLVKKLFPKPDPIGSSEPEPEAGKPARGKPVPAAAAVGGGGDDGAALDGRKSGKKAAATAGNGGPAKAPPPSPRKKKKRSGRRR